MRQNDIIKQLQNSNPSALFADGFDSAIVGYTQNKPPYVAVYDAEKCISILIESGMSVEEATDHFENHLLFHHSSPNDPIFISL
jgi:hypothetical protein